MNKRLLSTFLVVLLLAGFLGTSLVAASPLPFGAEVTPLSHEELDEVEGAWGTIFVAGSVGAVATGIQYLITTPQNDWNWNDGLRHTLAGAIGGVLGSFF